MRTPLVLVLISVLISHLPIAIPKIQNLTQADNILLVKVRGLSDVSMPLKTRRGVARKSRIYYTLYGRRSGQMGRWVVSSVYFCLYQEMKSASPRS